MLQTQFLNWYSTLEELLGLGLVLAISHLLFSFLIARILRFQWMTTALLGLLAIYPLYFDVPFIALEWRMQHPYQVYLFAWLACATILMGIRAGSFLRHLLGLGSGLLRSFFSLSLIASLILISSLYFSPQTLEEILPGWQGSVGLLMLCIALIALSLSTLRFLKAGALIVVWLGVCTVLATEVFLQKLPHQVLSEDFQTVPEFLPVSEISRLVDSLEKDHKQDSAEVLVLGGDKSGQIVEFLRALFRRSQAQPSVLQIGDSSNSSFELMQVARSAVQKFQPKVLIFGNWLADQDMARSVPGYGRLSDLELYQLYERRKKIAQLPFVQSIYESRIFQYFFGSGAKLKSEQMLVRVSPVEFQEVLGQVQSLTEDYVMDLLFFVQPRSSESKLAKLYQSSLEKLRGQSHIQIVQFNRFQERSNYDLLFASGDQLNAHGKLLLAQELFGSLQQLNSERFGDPNLPLNRTWTVASKKLAGDLLFQIEPQDQNSGYYRVVLSANGQFIDQKRFVGSQPTTARFKVPEKFLRAPFLELGLFAYRERELENATTAESNIPLPRAIYLAADLQTGIWPREPELIFESIDPGKAIKLAVLEPGTGEFRSASSYGATESEIENLTKHIRRLEWGTPVLLSVNSLDATLLETLSSAASYVNLDLNNFANTSIMALGFAGVKQSRAQVFQSEQMPLELGVRNKLPLKVSPNFL